MTRFRSNCDGSTTPSRGGGRSKASWWRLRSVAICRDWHHLGRAQTLDEVGRLIDEVNSRTINDYFAEQPPAKYTVVTLGSRELEMPQEVP